jgi:NADH:ubiquinone oxidoreductase subunit K
MLWAEIVIAAAILLFTMPVFLYKRMDPVVSLSVDEWFLLSLAISSVFFIVAAVTTFMGNAMWKFLHLVVAGMTAVMSAALLMMVFRTRSPFQGYYLVPLAVAALVAGSLLKIKKCRCSQN